MKYLGFALEEIPETIYLLIKEVNLLQSREQLWEIRKEEILALPDHLASMSAEKRLQAEEAYNFMHSQLETVFKKFFQPGRRIVFKEMPAGNEHAVRSFTTHYVIDTNIVCRREQVHKRLKALLGSDFECQEAMSMPAQQQHN